MKLNKKQEEALLALSVKLSQIEIKFQNGQMITPNQFALLITFKGAGLIKSIYDGAYNKSLDKAKEIVDILQKYLSNYVS